MTYTEQLIYDTIYSSIRLNINIGMGVQYFFYDSLERYTKLSNEEIKHGCRSLVDKGLILIDWVIVEPTGQTSETVAKKHLIFRLPSDVISNIG